MSWIQTAKVGDQVVCIETWTTIFGAGFEVGPVSGETYTIREIGFLHPLYPDVVCVRVAEICNPEHQYMGGYGEACFAAWRFRPVDLRKTDISWAHEILRSVRVRESA